MTIRFIRAAALPALLLLAFAAPLNAQGAARDTAGVRRAMLDYVEGFYEGDTIKLARAMSPTVYKYGFAWRDTGYSGMQMQYPAGFMNFARAVKEGRTRTPANAPKVVEIFDVEDQTASAKLTAWWGIDYMLLARQNDGAWKIMHVMWQSPPR